MHQTGRKFLFFFERDFHIALLKPLMLYIHDNNLGASKIYCPFLSKISFYEINDVKFEVVQNPWHWRPDITFMADFSYQYVEGLGKLVNIGHGTICKGWFFSDTTICQRENTADLICVPGIVHKKRLEKQVYKPIAVTGMPKLDNCFNNSLNKDELYVKYSLKKELKTVLLAPTFNGEFSILTYFDDIDMGTVFPDNINLIVKLHGMRESKHLQNFEELKLKTKDRNINIYIANTYDIDEFLFLSDVLITDVSSVIYEFLSLDKPVLLFDSPKQKEYINFNENDLEWVYRDVGQRFNKVADIPKLLTKSFQTKNNKQTREVAEQFISIKDGSSSERVIKKALNLLVDNTKVEITVLTITDTPVNVVKNSHSPDDIDHLHSHARLASTKNSYYKRFGTQYPYIEISAKNFFEASLKVQKKINTDFILFIHPSYECSPQIANVLLNHMKVNEKIGIVAPLIFDTQIHLQQVSFVTSIDNYDNYKKTAMQLYYAFTGVFRDIDFVLPYCFMVRTELVNRQFTNPENEKLSCHEMFANIVKHDHRILVAYDSLIKKIK